MLNTSLHNPNVKDKPSVQRFTAMNRGINDGGDLPEELLRVRGIYFPSAFPSVVYLDSNKVYLVVMQTKVLQKHMVVFALMNCVYHTMFPVDVTLSSFE